jgi:ferredoxin
MPTITFVNEDRIVEVDKGRNIRQVAEECGIDLDVEQFLGINCGGRGMCRACLCWVEESEPGAGGPRSLMERLRGLVGWRRLACRVNAEADLKVFSMPGGDERTRKQRPVSPPPRPTSDPTAPRKPLDASSSTAYPYGYPSAVGSGTRKPPEKAAAPAGAAAEAPEEEATE